MRRHKTNLSHYRLFTGNMGKLIPIGLVEVLPGDTFQHATSALVRLSPMVAPVMHGMTVRIHHFYVPHRLVWPEFEDFVTGGPDGLNNDIVPQYNPATRVRNDVLDYYGVPPTPGPVSELPLRGYVAIFNEFYRDQDLVAEKILPPGGAAWFPYQVAWGKDYFTTARPWEQKGDAVSIPVGGLGDLKSLFFQQGQASTAQNWVNLAGGSTASGANIRTLGIDENAAWGGAGALEATNISVSDLRRSLALQRFAEARARYGSRYTEYLRYLGIRSSDARLDRPEYLGGGKVRVNVSEVLQTAPEISDGQNEEFGVGDMYGHGIAAMRSRRYRRFFEEHGYVHSFLSVRPDSIYMNAVPRHWLRLTREDFFVKELQHIGQQPILEKEIYFPGQSGDVFGYQDRYREYREQFSQVSGSFRDDLNFWHLARDFDAQPGLNANFIQCDPSKRIFAITSEDGLWCMVQHKLIARRMVDRSAAARIV